ncbi:hypothetical protein LTR53_009031 [Teratosphaeriaceae sp. CCFEE 6253]|nr:hypothetical protein LTR53_009031 [Teratosphaeriaceae sp. CCFEE 6253]
MASWVKGEGAAPRGMKRLSHRLLWEPMRQSREAIHGPRWMSTKHLSRQVQSASRTPPDTPAHKDDEKPIIALKLSEAEQKLLNKVFQCFQGGLPKIDLEELTELCGYKNKQTASACWCNLKKKLLGSGGDAKAGNAKSPAGKGSGGTEKSPAGKGRGKKRGAEEMEKADPDGDGDGTGVKDEADAGEKGAKKIKTEVAD